MDCEREMKCLVETLAFSRVYSTQEKFDFVFSYDRIRRHDNIQYYYMEESVLLGTKLLVDSIRHSIRDPSGVFSVCHAFECHIVQ